MYVGTTRPIDTADKIITNTSKIVPNAIKAILSAAKEKGKINLLDEVKLIYKPVLFSFPLHSILS